MNINFSHFISFFVSYFLSQNINASSLEIISIPHHENIITFQVRLQNIKELLFKTHKSFFHRENIPSVLIGPKFCYCLGAHVCVYLVPLRILWVPRVVGALCGGGRRQGVRGRGIRRWRPAPQASRTSPAQHKRAT